MRDGWVEVTLGDLCRLVTTRRDAADLPGVPYIGLEHMPSNAPSVNTFGMTDGLASAVSLFQPDDTLFGRLRPYLRKVALAHFAGACSPEIMVLRPRTEVVAPGYLYAVASSEAVITGAVAASAGSRMPRTAADDLLAMSVPLPPLAEQRRIVDLIGALDAAIDCEGAACARADAALAAACISLTALENEADASPLAEVATILDSQRVPVSEAERMKRLGEVPYYGANGRVGWIDRPLFDEPLVLLAEDGGYFDDWATRAVAYEIRGPSWVNNHAHVLRATGVPHDWLYYSLRHRNLTSIVNRGTRAKLNQAPLRQVPIARREDIAQRTSLLRALDNTVAAYGRCVAALRQLRGGLLSRLLAGEEVIPDSYDRFLGGAS